MHGAQLIRLASLDGMQRLNVSRLMHKTPQPQRAPVWFHFPVCSLKMPRFQSRGVTAPPPWKCSFTSNTKEQEGRLGRSLVIYSGRAESQAGCSSRYCACLADGGVAATCFLLPPAEVWVGNVGADNVYRRDGPAANRTQYELSMRLVTQSPWAHRRPPVDRIWVTCLQVLGVLVKALK